jgi:hypothetical protein
MSEPIIIPETPALVASVPDITAQPADGDVDEAFKQFEKDWNTERAGKASDKPDATKPEAPVLPDTAPKLDFTPKTAAAPEPTAEIREDEPVPRTSADWKKFRQAHNERAALLKDRDAKIAEFGQKAESFKQLESIQKERDELASKLKEYSVVGDPSLTKDIDARMSFVADKAKAGLDPKKAAILDAITRMPSGDAREKMLVEFFEDLPPHKQGIIAAHIASMEQLTAERESRIEEARTNADSVLQQRQAQQAQAQAQRQQHLDAGFQSALGELKGKDGWKEIFANPEVASRVEAEAKQIYSGNVTDAKALASKALLASITPMLMDWAIAMGTKYAEAEKTISELRAAKPGVNATWTPQTKVGVDDEVMSLAGIQAAMNA